VGERVGTLVSVNVGLPRDVAWRGRIVRTGVWKSPVDGRRRVRRDNLDGDGQGDLAGHGGEQRAVLVYQVDSYRYWRRELGRDDLDAGAFGENFTVEGLPDDEVRIGDRYRVGSALFELTQPRVTCYRVGVRLAEPRLPALLVADRRPGFYLRVLEEGDVGAGDAIELVEAGPAELTVAEVDALLYLPGHPRALLRRAVDLPALSPGWRTSFQEMIDAEDAGLAGNAGLGRATPAPAWPGFRPLRVTAIEPESSTVTSFRLADPNGAALPAAAPGQYVTVRLPAPGGPALLRSYSLSGPPGAARYRISVQQDPRGAGSALLHDTVRPDSLLDTAAPRGDFLLRASARPLVLASAGVGATPPCSPCCTPWSPCGRSARSGGCTPPATALGTPSGRRPTTCSAGWPSPTGTSVTPTPAPPTGPTTRPAVRAPGGWPRSPCQPTPTPTCAAPPRSSPT
jgi:MOSC domain-containing protein YiiM